MRLLRNSLSVGYIHGGSNKDPFLRSLWDYRLFDSIHRNVWADADLIGKPGLYLDNNRNAVVETFLERPNKDALLWVDTDMGFDPQAIEMLIDTLDPDKSPIVSAFYIAPRDGRLVPEWWDYDAEGGFVYIREFRAGQGLQQLGACGMGLCLIHRYAFERFPLGPNLDDPWRWFGRDLGFVQRKMCRLDEDLCFCKRAADLFSSMPIYGHPETAPLVHHTHDMRLTFDDWLESLRREKQDV